VAAPGEAASWTGAVVKYDIFGRETELGALLSELSVAMKGGGRLVLVSGEPGIGKTTVLTTHAREARARGALVAWGRCHEMGGAPAYWPWLRLLEELVDSDELSGAAIEALAAARQSLRAASSEASASHPDGPPQFDTEHGRFELFAGVARALALAARKRGLVLALDDLHWADIASVKLLAFLASELASEAILIVATLRTHEAASEPILAELARLARSVPLGPLDRGAIESLLADRLPDLAAAADRANDGATPADPKLVVEEVWKRCDGNPFFVLELAHLLRAGLASSALPFAIKRVIDGRLDVLTGPELEVLRAASVIGREFERPLLARALERTPESLMAPLARALDLGLVVAITERSEVFAFGHALTREAIYEALDEDRAVRLHARVAAALEAGLDAVDTPQAGMARLAHHFYRARAELGRERAADYAFRAGMQMLEVAAYEEAAVHMQRALSLLPEGEAAHRRIEAQIALGEARIALGEREGAERVLSEAVVLAETTADPSLFGQAVLVWCNAREEIGLADFEGNRRVEEALGRLPDADSTLHARLLARRAFGLHLLKGAQTARRHVAEAALSMARRLGDVPTLSYVSIRALFSLGGPDDLEDRRDAIDAMLESCAGYARAELLAWNARADACAEAGDRAGLDLAIDAFDERARHARHPYFRWHAASQHAALALLEGRFEDAEERIVEALRLGERAQAQTPALHFAQQMFMLRGWQGRMAEVAPIVEAGAQAARIVPAWHCALASLYSHLGRDVEARRELDAAAQDDFGSLPRDTTWLTSMVLLAPVCVRMEDRERAASLYEKLEPFSGRIAVASPLIVMICPVDLRLGELAGLLGRDAEAERHFERALAQAESMRALPWKAETQFRRAEWLRRRAGPGDAERAEQAIDEAEAIGRSVGMGMLLGWIAEARAESPTVRAPATAPAPARFVLEGETWRLEFEGRTTRLRAMVGLAHLHRLIDSPDREIHVLDLARPTPADTVDAANLDGDAGPLLDARARAAYTERLRDLRSELERAEADHDEARREQLGSELEFLTRELERAFGLGGRERRGGAAAERARASVTRAIKYATKKIADHDPGLADHLARSVRTGTFCVYAPSVRDRIAWQTGTR
jgi:tetratricopeptide (TPR) repeat protein